MCTQNRPPRPDSSVHRAHPVDWSKLAQGTGYIDHAHHSKEFKDLTGHTPDRLPGTSAPVPRRKGVPAGQRPDARRLNFYKPQVPRDDTIEDEHPT